MEPTTPTNQPKLSRAFVSPEDATPETPLWRIVHQGKSAPFAFGDRSRTVRDGRCTAFESVQEFRAFAEFVEQHPDFVLANGSHQDPIDAASIESLPNNRVRYRTQRISGLPAKTVTSALPSVHRDLWVAELPWEPIPLEHRDWLKGKSARSGAKSDIADEETPRCWAGGHNWSTGSMLSEFLAASGWWHGFMPDDLRPAALQTRQLFPHIRVGDYFAIKGDSQQGLLKVCFTGTVAAIDATEQRLRLTPLPLPQTATIKPAKGTQTVSGTLREVTDPAVIDWMFHQQPYLSDLSDPSEPKVPPMPETQGLWALPR